jgi:hypothetical protein
VAAVVHPPQLRSSTRLSSQVAGNKKIVDINFHDNKSTSSKGLNGHTQTPQLSKRLFLPVSEKSGLTEESNRMQR